MSIELHPRLLATNPHVQERLQAEIDAAHAAGETDEGGRLTYNALVGMEYLDMVVQEVTRRYPPLGSIISREANREYREEIQLNINRFFSILPVNSSVRHPVLLKIHDIFIKEVC